MKLVCAVALTGLMLASCSDPKIAAKWKFQQAINSDIEKHPSCIGLPVGGTVESKGSQDAFPRYVASSPDQYPDGERARQNQLAAMSAMVDAGLLKVSRTAVQSTADFGIHSPTHPVFAYTLTRTGEAALYHNDHMDGGVVYAPLFCFGKPQVEEVTEFTEPSDTLGEKMSQVQYLYHLTDVPSWAIGKNMQAAFPDLKKDLAPHLKGSAVVVLTNDGWKDQKATGA
jgi:hypothetical protein